MVFVSFVLVIKTDWILNVIKVKDDSIFKNEKATNFDNALSLGLILMGAFFMIIALIGFLEHLLFYLMISDMNFEVLLFYVDAFGILIGFLLIRFHKKLVSLIKKIADYPQSYQ